MLLRSPGHGPGDADSPRRGGRLVPEQPRSPVPWCARCAHPSTFLLPDGTERCQTQQGARVFFRH